MWDFAFLGEVDPDQVDIGRISYDDRMAVPGCFDATPAYASKRGLSAYRRKALVSSAGRHRLVLDGVHHWGRIFIDGERLADHVGGFTRFHVDFSPCRAGEIEIVILVDNRLDPERCPLHRGYYDWYHFGGITRGVELHRLGELWIDSVQVTTIDYRSRRVAVRVQYGANSSPGKTRLQLACGQWSTSRSILLEQPEGIIEIELELKGAELWSPSAPHLHELHVVLGQDDLRVRFGIRQVQIKGRDILINGRVQRLLGFNRHEAHPQFGHAVPEQIMLADLQLLRDMECNFVRGSHYPQDSRFLDLCDELGMMVWSESIGWQNTAEQLADPRMVELLAQNGDEMIAAAFNHPSVIMWGILNEAQTDVEAVRPAFERLLSRLRELDPSRPVTFADCRQLNCKLYDLPDIIAINCYPGWYVKELADIPAELDKLVEHLKSIGQGHKPLIISEIGAAAVYGCHDFNRQRWSEEYQSRLLEIVVEHLFRTRKDVAGLSIWQFCDVRTAQHGGIALARARGFNNKGVVDEYRRPKLAYQAVKGLFTDLRK